MRHLRTALIALSVIAAVAAAAWFGVIAPLMDSVDKNTLHNEVETYRKQTGAAICSSTFDWANVDAKIFRPETEHNRKEFISRLSKLQQGKIDTNVVMADSYERLHSDILAEAAWHARRLAEKDGKGDRNYQKWEVTKEYLPAGWEQRRKVDSLYHKISHAWYDLGNKKTTAQLRQEFEEMKSEMEDLMNELNIRR